jgi:hypothetical protein
MQACVRKIPRFGLLLAVLSGLQCGSPFFPETGVPQRTQTLRETPGGVVRQLVVAYEGRRLDLFEDCIYSEQAFRFYVEPTPSIISDLTKINKEQTEDVSLKHNFIVDTKYIYLTYNDENAIHRNLFTRAQSIQFVGSLPVDSIQYFMSIDSVDATLRADSTGAKYSVVRTEASKIRITAQEIEDIYGETSHEFPVGKQLFYMKKDAEGLWRILLWFELST